MARKTYSAKLKFKIAMEVLTGEKDVAQAAKAYGPHPNSINKWCDQLLKQGAGIFERKEREGEDKQRIAKLERLLGQKEVEIALLKNFLEPVE